MKLEEHPFFRSADNIEVAKLAANACLSDFEAGQSIFDEGSPSDTLCLVLEGSVAFVKETPDGKSRTVSLAEEGKFFGEVGIFTGAPRSLSAVAHTTVRIAQVERDDLVDFIKHTPGPIEQILGSIVNHLHGTTKHYIDDMLQQEKMGLVGTMVNSIIHDFKNPFTLISLGAQLIRAKHTDPKTIKLCDNIEAQVFRMVEMANEISEFSKGEQVVRIETVDLSKLLDHFRELNEPFFQKEKVSIELQSAPIEIEGEENKLLRVLQNLVGNAIDAFDEGESGLVQVHINDIGDFVELVVSDNGKGIPESIRHNLFTPFVTYGKSRGTGLGTAIVKSIIEAHGGTIEFTTTTGEGTTFTIVLPKKQS
ncbi:ATP-binding protein [Rubellicoccus peritrichatus]|uniref:histidine kinase n=1 Tax=Rubellicoccus peritrichatus TaxID=3080537 RepID=A0AAQ3LIQ5_9BACT|nr:ATP-binding protein [Puniceicoccus sp. CR14]WOO42874.1 ATP-binding protein [Puniceicoccus sp. CR14]